MVENKKSSKKVVFLFSSSQRPVYKEDNLKVLCYPAGFMMHFRYDEKWVEEGINPKELENKDAVIVIVVGTNKPEFYPIRRAKIKRVDIDGSVWHFYFELCPEWVDHKDKNYQEVMISLRNKPEEGEKYLGGKFASFEELPSELQFSTDEKSWESIIEKIGTLESYKNIVFYRINKISEIGKEKSLKTTKFGELSGYTLKSDKKYIIDLSFNYGKDPPKDADKSRFKISVESNSFYAPIPDEISLGFRVDRQIIYISPKKSFSEVFTYLRITFEGENIVGANVDIPLKIKRSKWLYLAVVGIFIGLFLTAGIITKWQHILQTIGVFLTTFIMYYLYDYK